MLPLLFVRAVYRGGTAGATLLMCIVLAAAHTSLANPKPNPEAISRENLVRPILQSSVSAIVFDEIPLWQSASVAVVAGIPSIEAKTNVPLHHFDLPCQTCHTVGEMSGISASVDAKPWGTVDINKGCTWSCHEYNRVLNHPVGMVVRGTVLREFSLDASGRMTCLTCHADGKSPGGAEASEPMLHSEAAGDLCGSCHRQLPEKGGGRIHWYSATKAHLGAINPNVDAQSPQVYEDGGIDMESRICMGCHEGFTVTIPGYDESRADKAMRWQKMKDHPMGMDYQRIASEKSWQYNYPLGSDAIRLFDGKMGCGSCHSIYSGQEKLLAEQYKGGVLCRTCHYR